MYFEIEKQAINRKKKTREKIIITNWKLSTERKQTIPNKKERNNLLSTTYEQKLAQSIFYGIINFFKVQ